MTVSNSTLSGNDATGTNAYGGGIYVFGYGSGGGTLTVSNSTLAGNYATGTNANGGGISVTGGGTLTLQNSIVSVNAAIISQAPSLTTWAITSWAAP